MKYLSLFSGIGGFEIPLQEIGAECVGYSEIDKYAIQIYQKHFPNHKNYGDITTINPKDLPDFDLLCGGFPCQAFSIAGLRRGFDDTRGTLFFDIARILREKQPRLLLLENVKGLLSHDGGNTFKTIVSTLTELGYDLQWQVLNSKDHGVPQNRERVFIIGHLRNTSRPEVFPIRESSQLYLKEITNKVSDAQRIYTTSLAKTLKGLGGGLGAKTGLYIIPRDSYAITSNYYKGINTGSQGGKSSFEKGRRQVIPVIKDKHGQPTWTVRRLTPVECERLQGFPDGWTEGLSDTQRYKTLGNAVTVNVVRVITKKML